MSGVFVSISHPGTFVYRITQCTYRPTSKKVPVLSIASVIQDHVYLILDQLTRVCVCAVSYTHLSVRLKSPGSAVSLSQNHVAVGLEETNCIQVFKLSDLEVSFELKTPLRAKPSYVSISPSEKYIAAGDVMGKILLYDLETRDVKTSRWAFHTSKINAISWRPAANVGEDDCEEDLVATGSLDTNIFIYSVKRPMKIIKSLNAHKDGVNNLLWETQSVLVSAGADACIKKWKVDFE